MRISSTPIPPAGSLSQARDHQGHAQPNRCHGLVVAVLLAASLVLVGRWNSVALAQEQASTARPNVIFIFADDHAYQAVGAYGSRLNQTPHIDRLAREGMRFDRCYVTNSICGPMRAVIQSGKYSHVNGFLRNGNRFDGLQWTFPKALQQVGYQTAVIGKWHLGEHQVPQGFDYSEVLIGQGPYYNPPMLRHERGQDKASRIEHEGYTTDIITDLTLQWLQEKRDPDRPFFLMYQHKAPHREWSPGPEHLDTFAETEFPEPETLFEDYTDKVKPRQTQDMTIAETMSLGSDLKVDWSPRNLTEAQRKQYLQAFRKQNEDFHKADLQGQDLVRWKYQRYLRIYLACIQSVDDNVGRLLDYLDESGLAENTVVIYCSDQGFYLGEHGWFDKRWVYEESLRTPFLVRWPGQIAAGTVNRDIVSPVDFAATFCELAGAEIPENLHGRSLVPVWKGSTPEDWRTSFYYHYYEYPGAHSVRRHYAVVDGRYKLIHFYEPDVDQWELIDLEKDPLEQQNFLGSPEYAQVEARLREELGKLRKELDVPVEDPPASYPGRQNGG